MNNREILETWFRRVWHEEDLTTIHEMLVPDTKVRGLRAELQTGPDEFEPFAKALLELLSDIRISIESYMENGDWANALISVKANSRASGTPVSFTGQVLVKFGDDTIIEAHNHIDFITLYEQLGLLPASTMHKCLCGEAIA